MNIILNGKDYEAPEPLTISELVSRLGLKHSQVAVELTGAIVPRALHDTTLISEGDVMEIVRFIGGVMNDPFILAGRNFTSRLLVGTGRYRDMQQTRAAVEASGAEIVTVALRRMDLGAVGEGSIQDALPPSRYTYLPNSAGCFTAEEAVRTLRLARELGGWNLVKLEVISDKTTLMPDEAQTLEAARKLVSEGFEVMAYTTDSLELARALEQVGCAAVMPLAAPIGSGQGIVHPERIRAIVETLQVPVLVDAGVGTASDAVIAMELGCAGVLLNTAISDAQNPVLMATAMKHSVIAGRQAFLAGRMPKRHAQASSPPVA